jgi:hypothetical protein
MGVYFCNVLSVGHFGGVYPLALRHFDYASVRREAERVNAAVGRACIAITTSNFAILYA